MYAGLGPAFPDSASNLRSIGSPLGVLLAVLSVGWPLAWLVATRIWLLPFSWKGMIQIDTREIVLFENSETLQGNFLV